MITTRHLHAAFEFVVAVGAAALFLSNLHEFLAPKTDPAWRAAVTLFLFVALVALGFFIGSVLHIRRTAKSKKRELLASARASR